VNLIEKLEARTGAMKVSELCELLGVDDKHVYRMAARGNLLSFHVGVRVRFDPQEVANWLRLSTRQKSEQSQEATHACSYSWKAGATYRLILGDIRVAHERANASKGPISFLSAALSASM
jgi:excisionase family DNA binding protein